MLRTIYWCLLVLTCGAFAADSGSTVLISQDNSGRPLPRFGNGFTVFYDRETGTVSSFNARGELQTDVSLSLPESSRVVIRDVTANSAGVIAVAASAFSRDQQRVASVLIFVTVTGQIDRVVQTSPFASSRILFAPNGHLWAVGKV